MNYEKILFHIPHSSMVIPQSFRHLFYANDHELYAELLRMTDLYTDELFNIPGVSSKNKVVFPYSRLICDVERFREDQKEPMAARGMGVCYTIGSQLQPLKKVTPEYRRAALAFYDFHHQKLTDLVDQTVLHKGSCLIIDCHSFSSKRLPYELEDVGTEEGRPDICLGSDPYHTPESILESLEHMFLKEGLSVKRNFPFSGTLVPMKHYHKDPRVKSVLIEVNRSLYAHEKMGVLKTDFYRIRKIIEESIGSINIVGN